MAKSMHLFSKAALSLGKCLNASYKDKNIPKGLRPTLLNLCIFHLLMNPQKILPYLELNLCSEKTFC